MKVGSINELIEKKYITDSTLTDDLIANESTLTTTDLLEINALSKIDDYSAYDTPIEE